MTDERHQERLRKCVRLLRRDGFSYEEIPDHLESPHLPRLAPWEVYELANPTKSIGQVRAWRQKHYPGSAGDVAAALSGGDSASTQAIL